MQYNVSKGGRSTAAVFAFSFKLDKPIFMILCSRALKFRVWTGSSFAQQTFKLSLWLLSFAFYWNPVVVLDSGVFAQAATPSHWPTARPAYGERSLRGFLSSGISSSASLSVRGCWRKRYAPVQKWEHWNSDSSSKLESILGCALLVETNRQAS